MRQNQQRRLRSKIGGKRECGILQESVIWRKEWQTCGMKIIYTSFNWGMDKKKNEVCPHNGILFNNIKWQPTDTCHNMNAL